jgi:hypothetical protein
LNPELGAVRGVERILAEIEVTANLQHPNLLPLLVRVQWTASSTTYVEGESLRARPSTGRARGYRCASSFASSISAHVARHHQPPPLRQLE